MTGSGAAGAGAGASFLKYKEELEQNCVILA